MPGYLSTRKYSAAIIVGSKYTGAEMPDWVKQKCVYIPENGVDLNVFNSPREPSVKFPLRAVFIGRLVPYKGADMLLEAAAPFLRAGALTLHILGDGPQRQFLAELVDKLSIGRWVHFDGWVPHTEIHKALRGFDFLVLPSIREFGGGVVVEAMALGVTAVVADYGGPAELVDDTTGIRVAFSDKASLIEGLGLAIGKIVRSPDLLNKLGSAARQRVVEKLSWDAKADQILKIYAAVLEKSKNLNYLDYK
jgi:glycosyltransferase involved in cell wall biosynthesis